MESLLGKRCFLKRSFAISEEDFPINLTGTCGNMMFNKIKIVKDPWEIGNDQYGLCFCNGDDIIYIVGSIYEGIFNNGVDTWFTVTGGEDVNDPTTIEKIVSMCKYIVCEESYFQKSLDFKIIEFNRKIVGFPVSDTLLKIDGEFKIRLDNVLCFYANSIEFDRAASKIKFIGAIETLERYLGSGDTIWLLRRNNGYGSSDISVVVCEDFMYTGLEGNEEFMRWLAKNAKITPKKHKDRKITNLKGCTLIFEAGSYLPLPPLARVAGKAFTGNLNGSSSHWLQPGYIDESGHVMADSVQRVPIEEDRIDYEPVPDYGPSVPGDYNCIIFFGYDYCVLTYDTGLQQTLSYPVTITNVDDYTEDPYLIDYLLESGVKIIPAYVNGGTYEFKSVLSAFPTIGEGMRTWVGARGMVSYNLSGNEIVRYIESMGLIPSSSSNQSVDRIEFEFVADGSSHAIGYSFVEQKWYCSDSDAVPEDVTIKHFAPVLISNFCVDWHAFSKWVVENTNNFYMVKGSNTFEEFLTEICDLIRVHDPVSHGRHTGKIRKFNAQDALSRLSYILL